MDHAKQRLLILRLMFRRINLAFQILIQSFRHVTRIRSAADPGNVAEGLYEDLESEIYTPEHQAEYQKTLLRVIHENIDSFGF